LEKLKKCLAKLEPLRNKPLDEFAADPYLQDIVERNLEVAAQCCIDIANRIISIEGIVAMDAQGNGLHADVEKASANELAKFKDTVKL
jgi:uncharacterized protein YutE (UPF0331/DUF86 family)